MRSIALGAAVIAVAGCGATSLTAADYRDLAAQRSAAYADEAERLRSEHLFQVERTVDRLVADLEGDALQAAVLAETAAGSAALFAALADAVNRYAADLTLLRPPDPLRPAHLEFVAALESSITGLGVTLDALAEAQSFDEIDAAIGGSAFNDTQHRVDAACLALQRALAAQGAAADLRCREV